MTREIKKTEALSRMEMLGLSSQAKTRFEKEDKVSISDDITGTSSWAKGDDLKRIRRFEEQYKVLVYAVVRSHTQIGTIDCSSLAITRKNGTMTGQNSGARYTVILKQKGYLRMHIIMILLPFPTLDTWVLPSQKICGYSEFGERYSHNSAALENIK